MNIQSTRRTTNSPQRPAVNRPAAEPPREPRKKSTPPWRAITLNEAVVEIPQSLLELSPLASQAPTAAAAVQAGVSGLAALRAVQCFHDAESVEEILEGVSSSALALAGGSTFLPAGGAALHNTFMFAHGAAEFSLGVREITEELKKDSPARLELAAGVLDTAKGASTFLPLLFPETGTAVNLFQIGAIITKSLMEPHMERSGTSLSLAPAEVGPLHQVEEV